MAPRARLGEHSMTIRRLGGFAFLAMWGVLTCGCGAAPDPLANNNPLTNDTTDNDSDVDSGAHVVFPSSQASISEFTNSFVISVPIVGASLAGDVAGQITALVAPLSAPGWGSGNLSFDVPNMDWLTVTQAALSEAAGRGGLIKPYFLPIAGFRAGPIQGNLLDLGPAPGMATVGVLPIVFVTTDFEGFPGSGAGIEVGLWSQQAKCPTCAFEEPIRYQHEITPLISSVEIRQLRELGLWNDRVVVIIAKAGVWWARSDESTRVRNWMILKPTGGMESQVRCLTDGGLWPS